MLPASGCLPLTMPELGSLIGMCITPVNLLVGLIGPKGNKKTPASTLPGYEVIFYAQWLVNIESSHGRPTSVWRRVELH